MSFLVIEGLDGSGKSTQIKLLREFLAGKRIKYKYLHFPRTGTGIFGELIAMFLRGEFGNIDDVDPYLVSLIYAADRDDAGKEMHDWLKSGHLVVADRYVVSNVAFQCAKLESARKRRELKEWILHLEYEHYGIPRPDLNIFLDVPFDFTRKQLGDIREGEEREYLMGSRDIHEADLGFQKRVREVYLEQAEAEKNLKVINCYNEDSGMAEPGMIFSKIKALLEEERII